MNVFFTLQILSVDFVVQSQAPFTQCFRVKRRNFSLVFFCPENRLWSGAFKMLS